MTVTLKVLGQSSPGAATPVDMYTVPAATQAVISTVTIANRSATPTTFRLSVAVAGAAADNKQFLAYDAPVLGNDTVTMTLGITMGATDVLRVYATLATLSFNAFGEEKS